MLKLFLFDIYVITLLGYRPITLLAASALLALFFPTRNRWLRCVAVVLMPFCMLPFVFLTSS